ncbi:hypothetical protein GVN24_25320 [Rhizobium sp. CRIBSB]|nr:hypothetical protein [Rhizobium sp. CRIBSB]
MKRFAAVTALAMALAASSPAFAQDARTTYQLTASVIDGERIVAAVHTQVIENAPVEVSMTVGDITWAFHGDLFTVQGDGAYRQMMLEANLSRDGLTIAAPSMTFLSDHSAMIQVSGDDDTVIAVSVSPLDGRP